jgi:hypothetical protein
MDWEASVSGVTSEEVCFQKLATVRAHQQPITVLDSEGARVLTGSQDHTLRVFHEEKWLLNLLMKIFSGVPTGGSVTFVHATRPLWSNHGAVHRQNFAHDVGQWQPRRHALRLGFAHWCALLIYLYIICEFIFCSVFTLRR